MGMPRRKSTEIIKVNHDGKHITDPKSIANSINTYFAKVTHALGVKADVTLAMEKVNSGKSKSSNGGRTLAFQPVNEVEVIKVISKLKSKKSYGWDGLPPNIIKEVKHQISKPLCFLINQSLEMGIFPQGLKFAVIKPLLKGGELSSISNYRPISLLPSFSKIFEMVVHSQISSYLGDDTITDKQHGFRKGRSTTTALTGFINNITKSIDRSQLTAALTCDLSKAFDCVNHEILLRKLSFYGIRGKELDWFTSYLKGRKQRTEITSEGEKYLSEWESIIAGVPQGSILGPLLFNIYVNDLPNHIHSELILYADDTTAVICEQSITSLAHSAMVTMNQLNEWFTANGLNLNISKTNLISFKMAQNKNNYCKALENTGLNVKNSIKLLGVQIEENIKWKEQLKIIAVQLNRACYAISCMVNITSLHTRCMVYHGYIYPTIRYGITLWGTASGWEKIFRIQKKCLRIITKSNPRKSCRPLFKEMEILTLPSVYIYEMMKYVFENQNLFRANKIEHQHDTRRKHLYDVPMHRLKAVESSPYHMGVKIYNCMVRKLNFSDDALTAEKLMKIKSMLLQKCYYSVAEFVKEC
jgi:hypothetical protein